MRKVILYNAAGEEIAIYGDVIAFDSNFVEYRRGKYRSKIYCDEAAGEYFAEAPAETDGDDEVTGDEFLKMVEEVL